jgi:hypothetical protein
MNKWRTIQTDSCNVAISDESVHNKITIVTF